ncbi:uncharacterized protein LOC142633400 isoform X2 [Castanea sativa]|uniref:uncharacterized protein LOC142633400 isoform X2 n=1 Tax=Castanea sativa TaxID=21020 RepID=UPI003F653477
MSLQFKKIKFYVGFVSWRFKKWGRDSQRGREESGELYNQTRTSLKTLQFCRVARAFRLGIPLLCVHVYSLAFALFSWLSLSVVLHYNHICISMYQKMLMELFISLLRLVELRANL